MGWVVDETAVVAQHYLLHLFRDKLVESKSRVIIVSSGAVRFVGQTGMFESLDSG